MRRMNSCRGHEFTPVFGSHLGDSTGSDDSDSEEDAQASGPPVMAVTPSGSGTDSELSDIEEWRCKRAPRASHAQLQSLPHIACAAHALVVAHAAAHAAEHGKAPCTRHRCSASVMVAPVQRGARTAGGLMPLSGIANVKEICGRVTGDHHGLRMSR